MSERLPPCVSMDVFEGRVVSLRDSAVDCGNVHEGERFYVVSGTHVPCDGLHDHEGPRGGHDLPFCCEPPFGPEALTDEPDDAQAAFERGREYVRTGVME